MASRGICFRYIPNQDARSRVKQIRASSTRHASGAPAHPKVAASGDERSSKRLLYPSTGESAAPPYSRWPFRTRLGMEIDGALRIAAGVGCSARGTAVSDLIGRAMRGGESVLLLQTLVGFRERHPQSRNICARRACDDRAWCAVLQVQAAIRPRVTPFSARARVLSLTDHLSQKMLAIQFGGTQCPSPMVI